MNLLDNELVRKYFRCQAKEMCPIDAGGRGCLANKVLWAMQERIRKGELYLQLGTVPPDKDENTIMEWKASSDFDLTFHGYQLRLPDAFQVGCEQHGMYCVEIGKALGIDGHRASFMFDDVNGHPVLNRERLAQEQKKNQPPRDVVDEKIGEIVGNRGKYFWDAAKAEEILRELVALARVNNV